MVDWGKGSDVIGLLFWAGSAIAVQLGVGKNQDWDIKDVGFEKETLFFAPVAVIG